ncbi:hypothetical protein AMJ82_11865 [candidate division TA06 bacterium SM23_40]|uniref:Uncharacterized protein n=1 Tax=candidate division TA06 bacterium SM23_40 TaxID=1703774 RepID=A0A0S8G197_UNCT6|nr:MAG: hypothetical protein AMJ82_11865 [candidate division TA06 bacterium SM23_40]
MGVARQCSWAYIIYPVGAACIVGVALVMSVAWVVHIARAMGVAQVVSVALTLGVARVTSAPRVMSAACVKGEAWVVGGHSLCALPASWSQRAHPGAVCHGRSLRHGVASFVIASHTFCSPRRVAPQLALHAGTEPRADAPCFKQVDKRQTLW